RPSRSSSRACRSSTATSPRSAEAGPRLARRLRLGRGACRRRIAARQAVAVRTQGKEIVIGAVLTGLLVDVRMAPGIDQRGLLRDIRTFPDIEAGRPLYERLQPLLLGRIAANVEKEEVEAGAERLDLDFDDVLLGTAEIFEDLRYGNRSQHPE